MHQVVCFGEILWDKLPAGRRPGGAPMNVAIHLKKHGVESKLISSVGNDEDGRELKKFLASENLTDDHLQTHQTLPTGVVDVNLDENKQATYSILKPVAWDEIFWNENLEHITGKADALVFGSLACRSEISHRTLLKLLEASRVSIFDMNLRPPHSKRHILEHLMQSCHVLKINEHELEYLNNLYGFEGNVDSQLIALGKSTSTNTICLTLGERGAIVLHEGEIYRHAGFQIEVADTVGAGDAFLASFIYGFLNHSQIDRILTYACATGALVASKSGANPRYNMEDIEQVCKF